MFGKQQLIAGLFFFISFLISTAHAKEFKVVSTSGALTEILYGLGAEQYLVGVDTTSQWPIEAKKLPQVGYQRALSSEGVLSLMPTHVFVTEDAGPPAVLDHIKAAGVSIVKIAEPETMQGVVSKVEKVVGVLGMQQQSGDYINKIKQSIEQIPETWPENPRVVFLLDIGRGAPVAAGRESSADAVINLAGGINVFHQHYEGYKVVNGESMIAAKPDIILLTQRTFELMGGEQGVLSVTGLKHTPAGKNKRIIAMDGLYLLGFGPRSPQAVNELGQLFQSKLVAENPK